MKILVSGGTRFMGVHLVNSLIEKGYDITIANRGITPDSFGNKVKRVIIERTDGNSIQAALGKLAFDICFDSIAFSSNDVRALLSNIQCKKYISISTMSVYKDLALNINESSFDPFTHTLKWCNREDDTYDEIKRQAECAITQIYGNIPSTMIRFPYVIGEDDYTKRLYFYVEHIINKKPMYIDNLDQQIAFVNSCEAGKFISHLGDIDCCGVINGASNGTITIEKVLDYVQEYTGITPILSNDAEPAPYNGSEHFSLDVSKANSLGFSFSPICQWVFDLLNKYIEAAKASK